MPAFVFAALALCFAASLAAQTAPAYSAYVTGSGYDAPRAISVAPGQIATFYVAGLPQTATGLASLAATMNVQGWNKPVSVLSAKPLDPSTLAITVQITFDVLPESGLFGQPLPTHAIPYSIQFGETRTIQGPNFSGGVEGLGSSLCVALP